MVPNISIFVCVNMEIHVYLFNNKISKDFNLTHLFPRIKTCSTGSEWSWVTEKVCFIPFSLYLVLLPKISYYSWENYARTAVVNHRET